MFCSYVATGRGELNFSWFHEIPASRTNQQPRIRVLISVSEISETNVSRSVLMREFQEKIKIKIILHGASVLGKLGKTGPEPSGFPPAASSENMLHALR